MEWLGTKGVPLCPGQLRHFRDGGSLIPDSALVGFLDRTDLFLNFQIGELEMHAKILPPSQIRELQ